MRNAKGQLSGGENKGIRLPRVKERAALFAAGLPILCRYHGEHLEWSESIPTTQAHPVVRCRKCQRRMAGSWVQRNYLHALATWTKKRDAATEMDEAFLKELLAKQNNRCALTGVVFDDADYKPSLDRVDSSIGYLKTNVQLVLADVNRMKSNFDLSLFLLRCRQVTEHARHE